MIARHLLGPICLSLMYWMNTASAADDPPPSPTIRVKSDGGGSAVTILRGTPPERTVTEPCNTTSERPMVKAGVIGTGSNLWYVDSDGRIHACWLAGMHLRVVCSP
jgi:hypothetical protein